MSTSTGKRVGRPANEPRKAHPPQPWESKAVADEVQRLLNDLDIADADPAVRHTLQRWVYRADKLFAGDRGDIVLTLRCITESEGNGVDALLEPILCAVSLVCSPEFARHGVAFIAAFDKVDLRGLLQTMTGLRCFRRDELASYLAVALRSRVQDILGTDIAADAAPKAKRVKRARGRLAPGRPRQSVPAMQQAA